MMMLLTDSREIAIFDSPQEPPTWIETIDVENHEYRFCDDRGQRYVGVVVEPVGLFRLFRRRRFELRREGQPDLTNVLQFLDGAVGLVSNSKFTDLESLRRHLTTGGA